MGEAIYIIVGVLASGFVMLMAKLFGGDKGKKIEGQDTPRAIAAADKAAELLGRRALLDAKDDADKERLEKKLAIEDPIERLDAIAEELKDL
jgi:hypothetical protein